MTEENTPLLNRHHVMRTVFLRQGLVGSLGNRDTYVINWSLRRVDSLQNLHPVSGLFAFGGSVLYFVVYCLASPQVLA